MQIWKIVSRFIPEFWRGVRERNKIKSVHVENIRRLDNDQAIKGNFDSHNESLLGTFAAKKHFEVKSEICTSGYEKQDGYQIHEQSQKDAIQKLSQSVVNRIKIINILTIVFWMVFSLIFILLCGFVLNLSGYLLKYLTQLV